MSECVSVCVPVGMSVSLSMCVRVRVSACVCVHVLCARVDSWFAVLACEPGVSCMCVRVCVCGRAYVLQGGWVCICLLSPMPRFYQLLVTADGELFLHALNDGVVSDEVALCGFGAGEYAIGGDVAKVTTGLVAFVRSYASTLQCPTDQTRCQARAVPFFSLTRHPVVSVQHR